MAEMSDNGYRTIFNAEHRDCPLDIFFGDEGEDDEEDEIEDRG